MAQTFSEWRRENSGTAADYNNYLIKAARQENEHRFTPDKVNKAVNAGVQLLFDDDDLNLSNAAVDLLNLAVNAALSMLDEVPPKTLDEVIERNYELDPECEFCSERLRFGSEAGNYLHAYTDRTYDHEPVAEKTTDTVRGWVRGA